MVFQLNDLKNRIQVQRLNQSAPAEKAQIRRAMDKSRIVNVLFGN
jgi:hypothetical protein